MMNWRRTGKALQALSAHTLLLCFTLFLVLKLDHVVSFSWFIFFPLWLFHAVVARGRFSLPAPAVPHDRHAPCHAVVGTPLLIVFELLLCIYLESIYVKGFATVNLKIVLLPLLAFEIVILIDNVRFVEKLLILLRSGDDTGRYFVLTSRVCDCFGFLHHGSRLLVWWSIDESSREEQARLFHDGACGNNTFCGYPPEIVQKMPKKDLAEEVWRLQAALGEQMEITKFNQQEYERLQNEKVLCRVCFEGELSVVFLPCRHCILCSTCSDKCKKCPICGVTITEKLPVYD
ncbi:hypothetical protein ACH5RR_008637, partial [Cinchona calisaya]